MEQELAEVPQRDYVRVRPNVNLLGFPMCVRALLRILLFYVCMWYFDDPYSSVPDIYLDSLILDKYINFNPHRLRKSTCVCRAL